jgi:geranylgeranyl diphosphate synthase type I
MSLQTAMAGHLPVIEAALREALQCPRSSVAGHHAMMHYHMGWLNERMEPLYTTKGKRLRPLLCLLACEAAGGRARTALPAAVAIEILHNFSLAHDDIEDNSPTRRGRPALWKLWGAPQAINVGDALLALAYQALTRLADEGVPGQRVLAATDAFGATCVSLTEGQYLDMSFQDRLDVTTDEYMEMIRGKTAALLGLSTQLGALLAGSEPDTVAHFRDFGLSLGIAFQIEDDILGIWGDEALTGKSVASDILEKKKSLPVIYGLQSEVGMQLRTIYRRPGLTPDDIPSVLDLLQRVDALEHCRAQAAAAHERGLKALADSGLSETALAGLQEMAAMLRGRAS